ncbi:MAG: ABC transporter permease subunit [Nitrospira sp. CR2.1]|nr:ABC transporter permease subunit [Nitrospira sp. CR2.1]MBA5876042.1 ABC transporter permease subunit [Nitrospira sp. CR1.2]
MPPVQAIIRKELRSYFVSPIVYVVGGVFLLTFGFIAHLSIVNIGALAIQLMQIQGSTEQINLNDLLFRPLFASIRFVLLLILPILTMRLLAEERKLRTFEFLMTAPIRVSEIVIGKFISVYLVFVGMLLLTTLVPLTLALFSDFDWYPVFTGYLGLILLGGLFLAVGLFGSSITENQIVAAFTSFGILLMCWLLVPLGKYIGDTPLGNAISYLSFMDHFDRLVRGLIDTKDLVYFASGTVLMLFLAHRIVDSSRWK